MWPYMHEKCYRNTLLLNLISYKYKIKLSSSVFVGTAIKVLKQAAKMKHE